MIKHTIRLVMVDDGFIIPSNALIDIGRLECTIPRKLEVIIENEGRSVPIKKGDCVKVHNYSVGTHNSLFWTVDQIDGQEAE